MKNAALIPLLIFSCWLSGFAQNQNVSNGFVFDGEPYITVNPNNTQHLVLAWMGFKLNASIVIKTKVSFDAGATWSAQNDIPHETGHETSADPSLVFDHTGNLFLAYIDYNSAFTVGGIYLRKSTDGGLTWGNPTEALNINADPTKSAIDRPWMAIDTTAGPHQGTIYITSMNTKYAQSPPYNPYAYASIDGGASFEPWRYLDTTNFLAGSLIPQPMPAPTVSSNGTFHAIYPSYVTTQNLFPRYILASSVDALNSLTHDIALTGSYGVSDTLVKAGPIMRTNPANPNHLVFVSMLGINNDPDIFAIESFNGGVSWNSPIKVNDDAINNGAIQDMVWADFDTDGDLLITWRDRRNASGNGYTTDTEIMGACRDKDSTHFSDNFLISDVLVAHDTIIEASGNDFMSAVLRNDTSSVVWGDVRNGRINIWFNRFGKDDVINSVPQLLINEVLPAITLFPVPAKHELNIEGMTCDTYKIFSIDGRLVDAGNVTNQNTVDISDLLPGSFILELRAKKLTWRGKFIKH